MKTKML